MSLADILRNKGNRGETKKTKKTLPVPAIGAAAEVHSRLKALEAWAKSIDESQTYDAELGDFRPIALRKPTSDDVSHLDRLEDEGMDLSATTKLPESNDPWDNPGKHKKKKAPKSPKSPKSPKAPKAPKSPKSPKSPKTHKARVVSSCPRYNNNEMLCRSEPGCVYRKDGKCRKGPARKPTSPRVPRVSTAVPIVSAYPIATTPAGVPVVRAQTLGDAALAEAFLPVGIPKVSAYKKGGASWKRQHQRLGER